MFVRCLFMLGKFFSAVLESYYICVHMVKTPDDIELRVKVVVRCFYFAIQYMIHMCVYYIHKYIMYVFICLLYKWL